MNQLPKWLPYVVIGSIMLLLIYSIEPNGQNPEIEVSYSELKQLVRDSEVTEITLMDNRAKADLKRVLAFGTQQINTQRIKAYIPAIGDPELMALLEAKEVKIYSQPSESEGLARWLPNVIFWMLLIGLYFWFLNRTYKNMGGRFGAGGASDFLTGAAKKKEQIVPDVKFDAVAGQENAKREVAELVEFLRHPERFQRLGAEPPRGILLMGPPGTGKTLLARALAGEAGVPFFNTSASEFIEMFVGVGASRVRKMFEEAKKRAPSIIFIDELDSVGRMRGAGLGGGHDEREQTLNQILAEMDGFSGHEAVIVLAATNRPDVLDPALLRPGRFDRHVTLELPDKNAREAILKVHTKAKPLADDVDLSVVAAGTPGFSGADIKNLVNEAAISASREGDEAITARHFDQMRDKVMMGTVRTLAIQPQEHHRLAVHEAGHTVVAHFLPNADPLYKVTIIPRGRALGGTHLLPEQERHTLPEDYLKDQLAVMLGGRSAERIIVGSVSSGADDDIRRATQLARSMVARWGMADDIGPVDLRQSDEHPFLGREIAQPRSFSETTAHEVDQAVTRLLHEAEERAGNLIRSHRLPMEKLIAALEQQETLNRVQIDEFLGRRDTVLEPTNVTKLR